MSANRRSPSADGGARGQAAQLQRGVAKWSAGRGVEVSSLSLARLLAEPPQFVPPPPKHEAPRVQAAPPPAPAPLAPPPEAGARRAKPASGVALRADAPDFVPAAFVHVVQQHRKKEDVAVAEAVSLPAVLSVKKSHRGCAVVLLRDPDVLEKGLRQSVAVVDGVCVEVRRHGAKARHGRANQEADEDAEMGLFVAWGNRVEKKVSVSAEGLEAYFNALAGLPLPQGLEVVPPFEEQLLGYRIGTAGGKLPALGAGLRKDEAVKERLLGGDVCDKGLVQDLWEAKGRLDALWNVPPPPLARSLMTRVARAQLFPHSGEGGKEHENRAGDKLAELAAAVGLLNGVPANSGFLDLCGGPGAWSQFLLAKPALALRGFGFTLRSNSGAAGDWQADDKDMWYHDLMSDPRWKALWGADGTGDLLKPGNLEHCARRLSRERVHLCVADGGFSDSAIPPNLLELYFYRLLLAELLMAISCLEPGGRFVCKLYTAFSPATSALLYLTARVFDSVTVVKPKSSRVTGPERYLAAFGFRAKVPETAAIRAALSRAHALGGAASPLVTPLLTPLVPAAELARDAVFSKGIREMAEGLCRRQTLALNAVVDRAEFLEDMAMELAAKARGAIPAPPRQRAVFEPATRGRKQGVCAEESTGKATDGTDEEEASGEGVRHFGGA